MSATATANRPPSELPTAGGPVVPDGPFSLRESALFGFGQRHDESFDGTMRLGFCLDGSHEPVGAAVTQDADGVVHVETTGDADPAAAVRQVARVLSLDHDARPFVALGREDAVLARLLGAAPGLRPPLFHSAYESLSWAVLSARRPVRQMQGVRRWLSEVHGTVLEVGGQPVPVFPTPCQLLCVRDVPGLTPEKVVRLHGIAEAALTGALDVDRLRSLDQAEAERELQTLRGVGPFTASLVTVRALGHTDVLPPDEPAGRAVVGDLYGLGGPATVAQLAAIAEHWRPYRTWALVLVRAAAARLERGA